MPVPPFGHSSSVDSASSFNSSTSSLLALPLEEVSSQSDVADFVPSSSSMPRGDISAYGIAASPNHAASKSSQSSTPAVSATQKFKRAFGKRRRPSQGVDMMLSSGDEHYSYTSDIGPSHPPFLQSSSSPTTTRPAMAKITHLIVGRKARDRMLPDVDQPPPLPPKPIGLQAPPTPLQVLATSSSGPRPRSSVMVTSPSINAAIEFMRADEERQRALDLQQESLPTEDSRVSEETKEKWRRSDSTMGSGHTIRPSPHDAGSGKRLSAFMSPPSGGGNLDLLEFLATAPETEGLRQARSDSSMGKQSKRRSLSLNIHVSSPHSTSAPASTYPTPMSTTDLPSMPNPYSPGYSIPFTSSPLHTPIIDNTSASGVLGPGAASSESVTKMNIRERLTPWTTTSAGNRRSPSPLHAASASTSSPSLVSQSAVPIDLLSRRRLPVTSDASQPPPELQAISAVRQMQGRGRSPSGSSISNPPGIRQAATSLTSGAGAKALGLGKRAYEKVGRVWGGSQGSGSGSDTPSHRHPSPITAYTTPQAQAQHYQVHAPSSFPTRRTPNAPSGTWSIGSRSSSERDQNTSSRDTATTIMPVSPNVLGRLVRPPKNPSGGIVFGRNLWECVRDTKVSAVGTTSDSLAGRMIPALVYRCVQHLHKWGLEEEGLFRISGRSSHITRLRNEFDGGADYDITECPPSDLDPHAVASIFKAYLRELPEPILTRSLAASFEAAINTENSRTPPTSASGMMSKAFMSSGPALPSDPRVLPMLRKPPSLSTFTLPTSSSLRAPSASLIETLANLIHRLPRENRDLLQTVVDLMKATAARSKETKMPLSNLLLVFCPSLSMAPPLLRVLCDVSSLWEPPPVIDISRAQVEDEDAESDVSTDYDSDSEDGDMVVLSSAAKGKGRDMPIEDVLPVSDSEVADPQTDDEVILLPHIRPPRVVRRIPPPSTPPAERSTSSLSVDRPFTPDTLLRSGSSPSLDVPVRSHTPSPLNSEASLNSPSSEVGKKGTTTPRTQRSASPALSSVFVAPSSWGVMNQDKALPASPRSPKFTTDGATSISQAAHSQTILSSDHVQSTRLDMQPHTSSDSQLVQPSEKELGRSQALPSPLSIASRSAPNVAFPTTKTAPSTPTSLKKHTLTLSLGRNPKLPDDDEVTSSPSRRMVRRPSLNLLFNMKRNGPPSPRSRTPTISSPLGSPVTLDQAPWIATAELGPKTVTNALPPVLNLPIESGMDSGLGWDDVFGSSKEVTVLPPQPRPIAISQPSTQAPLLPCPPSPGRRPTTEYLLSSSGFFSANGPPVAFPSATAVLEAANSAPPSLGLPEPSYVGYSEDATSSGDDSPPISSPKEPLFSPAPHINFQLRRSSLEDEDWASAVLLAAGKPAESFA